MWSFETMNVSSLHAAQQHDSSQKLAHIASQLAKAKDGYCISRLLVQWHSVPLSHQELGA